MMKRLFARALLSAAIVAGFPIKAERHYLYVAEPGIRRLYGQGRKRFRRAAAGKGEPVLTMHEWRKRVKDLRYASEMLQRREPPPRAGLPARLGGSPRRPRGHGGEYTKLRRGVARRAGRAPT